MVVDGKTLAADVQAKLKKSVSLLGRAPRLDVIFAGSDPASVSFVKRKQIFGEAAGFVVVVHRPPESAMANVETFLRFAEPIFNDAASDAVIIQLPISGFSKGEMREILDAIPAKKDADLLSSGAMECFAGGDFRIMPPVVAAIDLILKKYCVPLAGKNIAVVGARGELVGKPVIAWLSSRGIPFSSATSQTPPETMREMLRNANIIISGAGRAGLITPDMVRDGVVALDAGTSGVLGALRGDFDPAVVEKASVFTPVPGGIGPLTVAALFQNVLMFAQKKKPA